MNRCRKQIARLVCFAFFVSFLLPCHTEADDSTEISSWEQLTGELSSSEYATREAATKSLSEGRETAFDSVLEATEQPGEAGARAVQILETWAFEADDAFAEQCERALMALGEKPISEAASLAESMLNVARDVRQIRAVRALRGHNANVGVPNQVMVFEQEPTALEAADGTIVPTTQDDGPIMQPVGMIAIFPSWTGGIDGLWQLQRLRHQAGLHVRVANGELPDADVAAVTSNLENTRIDFVGASLGLRGNTSTPLIIDEVFRGSAADRAGLRSGDVILDFDGTPVSQIGDLITLLRKYKPGNRGVLHYRRGEEVLEVDVTLQGWESMPTPDNMFKRQQQLQQQLQQRQLFPR